MITTKRKYLNQSQPYPTNKHHIGKIKTMVVWLLVVLLSTSLYGNDKKLSEDPRVASALQLLELWIDADLAYERIPGISLGVVYDQELIWSKGFGYADMDREVSASPQTIYSICSISKLFTSTAVLQLRDRGLLRLDDPVEKHLPWFKINQAYEDSAPITIEGLLTHSAGLPREADSPYWTEASFPSRQEIIDRLSNQETLYPARKFFQYSNLGLTLAGEIVAQVSGMSFAKYVQQNILNPLGLTNTSPEIPEAQRGKQLATGYGRIRRDGSRVTLPFYTVNGIAPAAGFASTVKDLAKFASWQFRLLENGGNEVLAANTLREMHRVHWLDPNWKTTWGLGYSISRNNDKTFVGHGGSCPGYRTQLSMQPKEKVAVVFMTNAQGVSTSRYTQNAYKIVAPAIKDAIDSPDKGKKTDPDLLKYAGLYERNRGGETAVLIWKGELAMVSLPTDNPMNSLTMLKHESANTFRRIRDDKELGEKIEFEVGKDGKVLKMWRHNNYSVRVR